MPASTLASLLPTARASKKEPSHAFGLNTGPLPSRRNHFEKNPDIPDPSVPVSGLPPSASLDAPPPVARTTNRRTLALRQNPVPPSTAQTRAIPGYLTSSGKISGRTHPAPLSPTVRLSRHRRTRLN